MQRIILLNPKLMTTVLTPKYVPDDKQVLSGRKGCNKFDNIAFEEVTWIHTNIA